MSRTKIVGLLKGKYHPSKLNLGASTAVGRSIYDLLSDSRFTDDMLAGDVENAIDEYLANEAVFILGENFRYGDNRGYQIVISRWVELHVDSAAGLGSPKVAELILKTY